MALVAHVPLVFKHPLELPGQALGLPLDRLLEAQRLEPPRRLVPIVRVGAVHGIAEQDHELHVGECPGDPPRRVGMEQVVRTGLADDHRQVLGTAEPFPMAGGWEARAVPAKPSLVVKVEEAELLREGVCDCRVPDQVFVERRGARALRADDDVVGKEPGSARQARIAGPC